MRFLLATAVVVVVLVYYRWSVIHRPWLDCWWCDGKKSSRSRRFFTRAYGPCRVCGGTGHRRRFGAWAMGIRRDGSRPR